MRSNLNRSLQIKLKGIQVNFIFFWNFVCLQLLSLLKKVPTKISSNFFRAFYEEKSLKFWKYLLWNMELLHNKTIICLYTLFFKFFQGTEFSVNLQSYIIISTRFIVWRGWSNPDHCHICHNSIFKWWQYKIIWLKNNIYIHPQTILAWKKCPAK